MRDLSREDLTVAALFVWFMSLNIGMNYLLRWAMHTLAVPTFQASLDSLFQVVVLGCFMCCTKSFGSIKLNDLHTDFWILFAFAWFYIISVVLNNASLALISLSINQLVKACGPLPTVMFMFMLTRALPSAKKFIAIVVIVAGTCLAIPFGSPNASTLGIVLVVGSTLGTSARQAFSQYLMARPQGRSFEPIVLTFWQSLLALPCLLILFGCNVEEERDKVAEFWSAHPAQAIGMSLAISVLACTYSITVLYFTRVTSAIALNISGSVKMVLLIVIPAVLDPTLFGFWNWFGTVIFFIGFLTYAYLGHLDTVNKQHNDSTTESTPLSKPPPPKPSARLKGCV